MPVEASRWIMFAWSRPTFRADLFLWQNNHQIYANQIMDIHMFNIVAYTTEK